MFLLFELLDYRVVQMQGKSLQRGRRRGGKLTLCGKFVSQRAHEEESHQKGKRRTEQNNCRSQEHAVGQHSHQSPPYQCRNRLPTKKATSAMLPRKTPNGI